jgi:GDP-L-fucose synthase
MKISHINIGCGVDLTIEELSNKIAKIVEYNGKIEFDTSQPDGTPQKLLDVSRLKNLGWQPSISLEEGIKLAYGWYLKNVA